MIEQGELNFEQPMGKLETEFWIFHRTNPHVYALFEAYALDQLYEGRKRGSINEIFEKVRAQLKIQTTDKQFKLNNNHRSFYARLLMDLRPELDGFFQLRKQKIPCTFGPPNDSLPPGDHIA